MSPHERHALLDRATIRLLERTSGGDNPRDYLRDCATCGNPLWAGFASNPRLYCGPRCAHRAWYLRDRTRILARTNAYYRRHRAGINADRRVARARRVA